MTRYETDDIRAHFLRGLDERAEYEEGIAFDEWLDRTRLQAVADAVEARRNDIDDSDLTDALENIIDTLKGEDRMGHKQLRVLMQYVLKDRA